MKIPSPHEVKLMQSDNAKAVLENIANKLGNKDWVKNNLRDPDSDPHWVFSKQGVITDDEKVLVQKELSNAGWTRSVVKNSHELGQMPCIIRVAVFVNPVRPELLKNIEDLLSATRIGRPTERDPNAHKTFFRPRN
jgi:hypothetical protein